MAKVNDLPNLFKKKGKSKKDEDEEVDDSAELGELTTKAKLEDFKAKMDKTVQTVVNQKLPMLGKLLNKNKGEVKATDIEENELDDLEVKATVIPIDGKKKITFTVKHAIYAVAGIGLAVIFLMDDPVPTAPPTQQNKKNVSAKKAMMNKQKKVVQPPPPPPPPKEVVKQEPVKPPPVEPPPVEPPPVEPPPIEPPVDNADDIADLPKDTPPPKDVEDKLKQIEDNSKVSLDDIKSGNIDYKDKKTDEVDDNQADKQQSDKDKKADDQVAMMDPPVDKKPVNDELKDVDAIIPDSDDLDTAPLDDIQDTTTDNDIIDTKPLDEPKEEVVKTAPLEDEEIIPQKELQPDVSTEITRKLLQDLEVKLKEEKTIQKTITVLKPTEAPSYEVTGRGLVYNCRDQHWACVEQEQYKSCRENYSWNTNESIPLECYPVAFLESEYDCAVVQQEKIDSVSSTAFCSPE